MAAVIAPHHAPWHRTPPVAAGSGRLPRPALRLVPGAAPHQPADEVDTPASTTAPSLCGRLAIVAAGTLAAVVVALVLSGLVTLAGAGAAAPGPAPTAASPLVTIPAAGAEVVVGEGDTLWSIARSLRPSGDLRVLVDQLAERSGGPNLQPGQRIDVSGLG